MLFPPWGVGGELCTVLCGPRAFHFLAGEWSQAGAGLCRFPWSPLPGQARYNPCTRKCSIRFQEPGEVQRFPQPAVRAWALTMVPCACHIPP